MQEIIPNQWHRLEDVFGQRLSRVNDFRAAKTIADLQERIRTMWGIESGLQSTFKGSDFHLRLDLGYFSLDSFAEFDGNPIYYPLDEPTFQDIDVVFESEGKTNFGSDRFGSVKFMVNPPLREDIISYPYTVFEGGLRLLRQDYRYRLLLRSNRGVFVSEEPTEYVNIGDEIFSVMYFDAWKQFYSQTKGHLYLPLEAEKLSPLEIKLEKK